MINKLFSFLALFLVTNTYCQTYFSNLYDVRDNAANASISLVTGRSQYVLVGTSLKPDGSNHLGLVGIDKVGNEVFNKTYDFGNSVPRTGKAITLSDGNFLLWDTFQDFDTSGGWITWSMLLKFDTHGDTLWTRRWDKEPKEFAGRTLIEAAPDSIILIAHEGTYPDIDPVLLLVDSNGNELNRKVILTNPLEEIRHVIRHKNGKFYARGSGNNSSSPTVYFDMVFCFDLKFNLHFAKHYPHSSRSIGTLNELENDQMFICGDSTISLDGFNFPDTIIQNVFWIDTQGNLLKNKTFGPKLPGQRVLDGLELPNGNLLLYTLSDEITNNVPSLIELDSNHNPVRENRYIYKSPNDYTYHPWFFGKGIDGGYVFGGDIIPVQGGSQDLWLFKVDSAQCNNPSCHSLQYDLRTIGVEEVEKQFGIKMYPNPAGSKVNLSFEGFDPKTNLNVTVFDKQGRKVLGKSVSNAMQTELDLTHLASDLYVVRVLSDTKMVFVGKFVKR